MKNKKGFTLVELILVLTVTAILLGVVVSIFLQSISYYKIDETKAANQDSLNLAASSIERNIRSASSVTLSGSDCVVTTATGTYAYSLNLSTHVLSINSSPLTSRIAQFTCTVTSNVVDVSIKTINDSTGNPQSFNTKIVIRK